MANSVSKSGVSLLLRGISSPTGSYSLRISPLGFPNSATLQELQTDVLVTDSNQRTGFLKPHLTKYHTWGDVANV